jgi:hypothetical protein
MVNDKFIIPQNKFSVIAEYEDNLIRETGKIDIPYSSKNVFLKNRLMVSLCFNRKSESGILKIFDEHGNQLLRKTKYNFESINFKDNVVYLNLTDKMTKENVLKINDNTEKYKKLLKINNECCIILNEEKYKLVTF